MFSIQLGVLLLKTATPIDDGQYSSVEKGGRYIVE